MTATDNDYSDILGDTEGRFRTVCGFVTRTFLIKGSEDRVAMMEIRSSLSRNDYQKMFVLADADILKRDVYGRYMRFSGHADDVTIGWDGGQEHRTRVFRADSAECDGMYGEYVFTDAETESFRKVSEDPGFFAKLVGSIAPQIQGMDDIKEALVLQLFGGVGVTIDSGEYIHGNINILIIADADTGVSSLIESMGRLSPRGILIRGTPGDIPFAGRMNEYGYADGLLSLDVGAVTLANNGHVCIRRFDFLGASERHVMHDVNNQGRDSFYDNRFGGILPADTSVVASVTPVSGSIDPDIGITEQFGIYAAELSRFGLVYTVGYDNGWNDYAAPFYSEDFIRRYVAYARSNCSPVVPESLCGRIADYYLSLRRTIDGISSRQLKSLMHLAQASARSRLSDTVEDSDISRAIAVMDGYLTNWCAAVKGRKMKESSDK